MTSNICGNCANFKPKLGEEFFNCTSAKQAGVRYAIQVRADTGFCEAFTPIKPPPKPQTASKPVAAKPLAAVRPAVSTPKRADPLRGVLCGWGRLILVAVSIVVILLIVFGVYKCVSGTSPAATPTPAAGPPPTPVPTQYLQVGSYAQLSDRLVYVTSPLKIKELGPPYTTYGQIAPAGTSFVFVTVTETNLSNHKISVQAKDFFLAANIGNFPYQPLSKYYTFWDVFPENNYDINPGQIVEGRIMFLVPDPATDFELVTLLDGHHVVWKLGF